MMSNTAAVIIPLYKASLSPLEEISLQQCFNILSAHKIIAVKPESLSLDAYGFPFDEVVSFDDEYFANVAGYNKLMLSSLFYERFLSFKFLLIYQPDVFVFQDDLLYWCNSGYDYIGAPWLKNAPYPDPVKMLKSRILNYIYIKRNIKQPGTDIPASFQLENRVGNGGFSLRNTRKFYDICCADTAMIDFYNSRKEDFFGEDIFWSLEANRKKKRLNIPGYKKAVHFSIENSQEHAFAITGGKLPFGCHAWDRNLDYWAPVLKAAGVDLTVNNR